MFGDMFGVPEELRPTVAHAADEIVAWADPVLLAGRDGAQVQVEATTQIHQIAQQLIAQRREAPADDLLTNLVEAEVDGEKLTDLEISATMVLFAVAATDTTRHTASFAVKALTDYPDQRQWLWEDFEGRINSAVEEFLRWGSVVLNFRRTAVAEYELNGQHILPGDKVVMMYPSGNRDAEVFDHPESFDPARQPNPHIAFGGGGLHFCLGNQLAKSMLRSLSPEQRTKMEAMAKAREAKGPQSHTQQTCVTKEMLAKAMMAFGGKDGCTSTVIRSSRRAQDVRFTCTDSNSNMKGTGEFHIDAADSEHVTGTSTVKMEGGGNTMDVKASFTSHWVSADCGAQKH